MLQRVIANAIRTARQRKLAGGPQSLKPMRPTRGSGIKNNTGLAPKLTRQYVVPRQNPLLSPKGGVVRKKIK